MSEELTNSEMSDNQVMKEFEGHACPGESCGICYEYMRRFNPDRLTELGWDEPEEEDNFI